MKRLGTILLSCLAAAVTCLIGPAAYAGFSYDFASPPPATFTSTGMTVSGVHSATFSSSVSGGVLRISDSRHPDDDGAGIGFAVETSQVFTDVRASATLNPAGTSTNALSVLVRDGPAGTYGAAVDFRTGILSIVKIEDGPVDGVSSTDRDQGSQPALTDLARSYFLQVDAIGNTLTARLFDSPGGTQLRIVHYTDIGEGGPPLMSGFSGVSAVSVNRPPILLDGTFDNLTSTAVPEPGVAALGVFVGLALCQRRRARLPG
jgi:hypothetical protein